MESNPLEIIDGRSGENHSQITAHPGTATPIDHQHQTPNEPAYFRTQPAYPQHYSTPNTGLNPAYEASQGFYDLGHGHVRVPPHRPTLENLTPSEAATVSTPEQLLGYCCQFPACYDPLYELCIDTCRKCETVYPVTSWLPCPPLLNIPDCTSEALSARGRLPLACYPDIGPFANIMPVSSVMKMTTNFYSVSS